MVKKDYLITSINFGGKNHPSRIIAQKLRRKLGRVGFSKFIRDMLLIQTDDIDNAEKKVLMFEYYKIKIKAGRAMQEKADLCNRLEKLGVDVDDL